MQKCCSGVIEIRSLVCVFIARASENVAAVQWDEFLGSFDRTTRNVDELPERCSRAVKCVSVLFWNYVGSLSEPQKTLQPCSRINWRDALAPHHRSRFGRENVATVQQNELA